MADDKVNILFITPTLHRTGSELVLFNLIHHLDKRFSAAILSVERGSLYDSLPAHINKSYLVKDKSTGILSRIYKKFAFEKQLASKLAKHKNGIWYVNTIVLPYVLNYSEKFNAKLIIHTHELEHMFSLLGDEEKIKMTALPALVIANSLHSAKVFIDHGYKGPVEICYPFIDTRKYKFDEQKYSGIRNNLNISNKNFVWLMCGTIDENKNPDLFIKIAGHFSTVKPEAKFIWLGDNPDNPAYKKDYVEKSRHLKNLIWIHEKGESYLNYMNCCDGFVLTSQFESFSLVTLEALALGKPLIVNNCGGVSEIINTKEIGVIIKEKNDLGTFCSEMLAVMDKHTVFNSDKAIERSKTFDISNSVTKWNSILNTYCS